MDMTNDVIRAEREKPSMMDAFTAMTLERRMNKKQEPTFVDFMTNLAKAETEAPSSFLAWTNDMMIAEQAKPSMTDSFTAMTIKRRANQAKQPNFVGFMTTLAQEHSAPHSFMDMTNDLIRAEREKPSMMETFNAMHIERRLKDAQKPSFGAFMTNLATPS